MNKTRTIDITTIALMTAVTAVMAQIAIPMPAGVPMTLQTLAVTLAGVILGSKQGAVSMLIYLLLGGVGLPVFSGFKGGLAMLVGPTGGFIISFPIMAFLIGLGVRDELLHKAGNKGDEKSETDKSLALKSNIRFWSFMALGTIINYVIGTVMFCFSTGSSLGAGIAACVIPFIPTTIIKALVGGILGLRIRRAIPYLS